MNSGFVAFLMGVLAVIGAWIMGKVSGTRDTETRISGQVTIEQQRREAAELRAEKAEREASLSATAAELSEQARRQEEETGSIRKAPENNVSIFDTASDLAKRAKERIGNE